MTSPFPRAWGWLACSLAVALAGVSFSTLLTSPGRRPTGLQLVVAPHPDDEAQVWAAIEDDPSTYTVVVTLTRGEATANCARMEEVAQVQLGERLPAVTATAPGTAACGDARIDSWRFFLQRVAESTPEVALGPNAASRELRLADVPGSGWVWFGGNAAHVALPFPDGGLTGETVGAGVRAVLDLRGDALPNVPLRRILAASYWNDSAANGSRSRESGDCPTPTDCPGDPEAFEYEHRDHRVAAIALVGLAREAKLGTWLAVPPGDNEALVDALGVSHASWRVEELSADRYSALMGLGPPLGEGNSEPERLGAVQIAYGWLSFPGRHWAVGDEPLAGSGVLFPRRQTFLVASGADA